MALIVVVGSANMDLVAVAPRLPRLGETVIGSRFEVVPGGKGSNQAVAARRMGADVAFVARVGADAFGDQLLSSWQREGIDVAYVARDRDAPTGIALIEVDRAGRNRIVVVPGANALLSPADVARAEEVVAGAQVVLAQLEVPLDTVDAALRIAGRHNVPVVLNPAPARPLPPDWLPRLAALTPNETEASFLAQLPARSVEEAAEAARCLRGDSNCAVVITLGEKGALLAIKTGLQHVPAYKMDAVDTTAAGDAFSGALAVALAERQPWPEAVAFANAAGALATTKFGAQPSLPTREEVERLLRHNPSIGR